MRPTIKSQLGILGKQKTSLITSLITYAVIIAALLYFRPSQWWGSGLLVAVIGTVMSIINALIFKNDLKPWQLAKSFATMFITISVIHFIWVRLESHGWIALAVYICGLAWWKMWKQREFVGAEKAKIEILLFGEPQSKKWKKRWEEGKLEERTQETT